MKLNLTTTTSFEGMTVPVMQLKEFLDALPTNAVLSISTYTGDQREQTRGGTTFTARWAEEK